MNCKIDNCNKEIVYKKDKVCQMHYFRFMRNGTYDLIRSRKYRRENPAGYQLLFEPKHKLAQSGGYVYEHRLVAYEKYGDNLPDCELCEKGCSWEACTTHIDHIDFDVSNNKPDNLRPLCNACNSRRGLPPLHESKGNSAITYNELTMTAQEWARQDGVKVVGATITWRLSKGMSVHDALFSRRKTHNSKD